MNQYALASLGVRTPARRHAVRPVAPSGSAVDAAVLGVAIGGLAGGVVGGPGGAAVVGLTAGAVGAGAAAGEAAWDFYDARHPTTTRPAPAVPSTAPTAAEAATAREARAAQGRGAPLTNAQKRSLLPPLRYFTEAELSVAARQNMQRVLAALGHYRGAIDGALNPTTRAGVATFQSNWNRDPSPNVAWARANGRIGVLPASGTQTAGTLTPQTQRALNWYWELGYGRSVGASIAPIPAPGRRAPDPREPVGAIGGPRATPEAGLSVGAKVFVGVGLAGLAAAVIHRKRLRRWVQGR